ncbi:hypothetical protein BZG36_04969 [Bifiguratus adelaidae]|uniref:tRNA-5-taurinomethyluridine 2-sulfurtransferase n=1 Tax=Bifiguratus adelaidae TaxID=1938954 RepID=A0A261XUR1_9FUNG|nr:hypothetical protein BZG36_04969 [Bifiguratus adelaidae]
MSGGVDSTLSALLLKNAGYDVHAVFMRNWDPQDDASLGPDPCPASADFEDVQWVDFVKEYWNQVFERTLADYAQGITPNPDVLCNSEIKFGEFMDKVLSDEVVESIEKRGKDQRIWLATGHYARTRTLPSGETQLLRGLDRNKDQSYYLSMVSEQALRRTIFPVGHLPKPQVKAMVAKAGLERISNRPESMGICFVGKRRKFSTFLAQYIERSPGEAVDLDGRVIGQHKGLFAYTIGQAARIHHGPDKWFVLNKDMKHNRLICVNDSNHRKLFSNCVFARQFQWINGEPALVSRPDEEDQVLEGQIRYRQEAIPCTVQRHMDSYKVTFSSPIRAIAEGQNVVLWRDETCLGGGVIHSAFHEASSA